MCRSQVAVLIALAVVVGVACSGAADAAVYYWDTSTDAGIQAGSGTWDLNTTAMWSNSTDGSSPLLKWPTGYTTDAVFYTSGTSTVTVGGASNIGINNLTISGTGYTLNTSARTLNMGGNIVADESATITNRINVGGNATWTVAAGKTLDYASSTSTLVASNLALTIVGEGTINTYAIRVGEATAGTMNVQAGTLNLGAGTLSVGAHTSTTAAATLNISGGTINGDVNVGNTTSIATVNQTGGLLNDATGAGMYIRASTGSATYNLDGGVLQLSHNLTVSGAGAKQLNFGGGTLATGDAATVAIPSSLAVTINAGGATLDTPTADADLSVAAAIGGTGSLTKTGAGTLTLSGDNSYGGTTTVSGGTMTLSDAGDINSSSSVIVDGIDAALLVSSSTALTQSVTVTEGTLGGTGTINGPVSLTGDSILSPGESIGTLTIGSALALAGTTYMEIDKNPTISADLLNLGANMLTFGGMLQVLGSNVGNYAVGDSFNLFDAGSFAGSFSSFQLPTLAEGLGWNTTSLGVDGTLSVDAVPEPSGCALMAIGLTGLLAYAWRRRK